MAWRGLFRVFDGVDLSLETLTSGLDTPDAINAISFDHDYGGPYQTPLKAACLACRFDFAQWLLNHGANPNLAPGTYSPLDCVWLDMIRHDQKENRSRLARLLLDAGARLTFYSNKTPRWVGEYYHERQRRRAARRALGAILIARGVARDVMRAVM